MKGLPAPFFTLFDRALAPHVMYTGPQMKLFKNTRPIFIVLISTLAACASGKGTGETSTRAANQAETTPVTDENYALAETQIIIEGYV
jgi:hypothetical protein